MNFNPFPSTKKELGALFEKTMIPAIDTEIQDVKATKKFMPVLIEALLVGYKGRKVAQHFGFRTGIAFGSIRSSCRIRA
jgi:hypothetical protein